MTALPASVESIRESNSPVATRELGYVHPDIFDFYRTFLSKHSHPFYVGTATVGVRHVSPARITMVCGICNAVGARSLDNRRGVK